MSKKCKMVQIGTKPKFKSRQHNRCLMCGRSKAYMRKFSMCRICFRLNALKGLLPGVMKSSW